MASTPLLVAHVMDRSWIDVLLLFALHGWTVDDDGACVCIPSFAQETSLFTLHGIKTSGGSSRGCLVRFLEPAGLGGEA